MGGYGSGRWGGYSKKATVEESLALTMAPLRDALVRGPGVSGSVTWSRNGETVARIGYTTETAGEGLAVRLKYTVDGKPVDCLVHLAETKTSLGGRRWYFRCPADGCGRRAEKLYLPPGGAVFACRACYGLTYESCQESHRFDKLLSSIAASMGQGLTGADVGRILRKGRNRTEPRKRRTN